MNSVGWERPRAVLFDMDGTLTCPLLDFDAIRRDMGLPRGRPILEAMLELDDGVRATARAVLLRHEREAAERATLNDGCVELLATLRERRVPVAVVTRNSLESAELVLGTHRLEVGALVTREDEPYKPSPEPLLLALRRLGVACDPAHVWMVGDGEHDIAAANAAGTRAVWLSHGRSRRFSATPCLEIRDLVELTAILQGVLAS